MKTCLKSHTKGFTIVELLIVIVVIAILAAITIVAYNGVANMASDSTAKSNIETAIKKLEVAKIDNDLYPLKIEDLGIISSGDIRTEYSSDGSTYCVTISSVRARTDYHQANGGGAYTDGTCPNHRGYEGGPGTFSTSSIFGDATPVGSYQVFNDGGGNLWIGDRFYTTLDNGITVMGARVWEPATASAAFLSTPISVQVFTQDWQGTSLGGWGALGSPVVTKTYTGVRKAGAWTYIWFDSSAVINKVSAAAGAKDMVTVAVRYDGSSYVAASPEITAEYVESNQMSGVYLSENGDVGRAVSNVYSGVGNYYYGIDILFTAL